MTERQQTQNLLQTLPRRLYLPCHTMTETGFNGIESLITLITQKETEFAKGILKDQYVLIQNVPRDTFENLHLPSTRLHYDYESGDLIVKFMPSAAHNCPPMLLTGLIRIKATEMGFDMFKLRSTTTNRYEGASSTKEGDGGLKPIPERKRANDWPVLVIECGVFESLPRLRIDAGWWLVNSTGQVRTVIVISFDRAAEKFRLEKWQLGSSNGPDARARPNHRPCSTAFIDISREAASDSFTASNQLVSGFQELFLRQPFHPETDIVFTKADLVRFADLVMSGLQ